MDRIQKNRAWLLSNLRVGALSFGSSARTALYEADLVHRSRVVDITFFQRALTFSSVVPGPNLVNLCALLGFAVGGLRAAVIGVLLLCVPGALFVVFVAEVLPFDNSLVSVTLVGISIGSALVFLKFVVGMMGGLNQGDKKLSDEGAPVRLHWRHPKVVMRLIVGLVSLVWALNGLSLGLFLLIAFPVAFFLESLWRS